MTGDVLGLAELHRLRALALTATGAAPATTSDALDTAEQVARDQGAVLFLDRALATRAELRP